MKAKYLMYCLVVFHLMDNAFSTVTNLLLSLSSNLFVLLSLLAMSLEIFLMLPNASLESLQTEHTARYLFRSK